MVIDYDLLEHVNNDMPALYYLQKVGRAFRVEVDDALGHKYSRRLRHLKKRGEINKDGGRGTVGPYYLTSAGKEAIKVWERAHEEDAKLVKSLISKIFLSEPYKSRSAFSSVLSILG